MSDIFTQGKTAVITGAASGIGYACVKKFSALGMNVVMADNNEKALLEAAAALPDGGGKIVTMKCDVAIPGHMSALKDLSYSEFTSVQVLMLNAGISGTEGGQTGSSFRFLDNWRRLFDVNFFGQRNGLEVFVEPMMAQDQKSVIVCTGSKQGITNPPGNGAYNATKAAVKSMAEHLSYELAQAKSTVSAFLLIPGWTYTSMTAPTGGVKPNGAWTAEQVTEYMIEKIEKKEFYILCPDNVVDNATDHARILWNVSDIVHRRPPLSRWLPEYADQYAQYMEDKL